MLIDPPANLVIKSNFTHQQFFAEDPLKMASSRKQLEMVKILLPYYDKIESIYNSNTELSAEQKQAKLESLASHKAAALYSWKTYDTQKNADDIDEIIIPDEYVKYAQSLVDVFVEENLSYYKLSTNTQLALSNLLDKLVPENPVKIDNMDIELFLLATFNAYRDGFNLFRNYEQREAFCIRVIGLIQSALSPETGKIWCQGFHNLVDAITAGKEIALCDNVIDCKTRDGHNLYRSLRIGDSGSGFTFLTDSGGTTWRSGGYGKTFRRRMWAVTAWGDYEEIMSNKNNKFVEITQTIQLQENQHFQGCKSSDCMIL